MVKVIMTEPTWDPRFGAAVETFNRGEFFAAHDAFEEIWNENFGEEREFYKGLIHVAVALFHFSEGNPWGARKKYESATRYLTKYPSVYMGLDVGQLLHDFSECFSDLLEHRSAATPPPVLDEKRIPLMRWIT